MKVTVQYGGSLREIARRYGIEHVIIETLLESTLFSSAETGEKEAEISTFNSSKYFDTSLDVVEELRKQGLRPAVMQEFLTFIGVTMTESPVSGLAMLGARDANDLNFIACVPFVYSAGSKASVSPPIHISVERMYDVIHSLRETAIVVVKL